MARNSPAKAMQALFHAKPRSREEVELAAKRLSLPMMRPAAPLMENGTYRSQPPSSRLRGFA
jgi:hypothetical protein